MTPVRLLLVEDNFVDALCLQETLQEAGSMEFEISHVETLAEAKERLAHKDFHVVVVDLGLPDSQGLTTFTQIQDSASHTPVVVLSGLDDETVAIEALRKGAQDYLIKDQWDGHMLSRAINYAIERQRLLAAMVRLSPQGENEKCVGEHATNLRDSPLITGTGQASSKKATHLPDVSGLSRHDMGQIIHELHVHQIELEMQNEELRKAQLDLQKSREEYADLYEFAPVGYFTLDERGVILKVNLTGAELLGQERKGLLNTRLSALLSKSDADTLHLYLTKVFRTRAKQSCELQLKNESARRYIRLESVVIADSEDPEDRCRTILTDITDRKIAEETLRQGEKRFRAVFEGAEDPIFLKDRSLRFTQVNPAFEKLVGAPASEIVGKTHEDVFGTQDSAYISNKELRVLEGDTIEDEHVRTIREVPMTFLAMRTPLRDASGETEGILTILHNITDRKRIAATRVPAQERYPSRSMQATLNRARMAAKQNSIVLLLGESGSGKDHLARYIHDHSPRADGPYFAVNCAAISRELAESELFGHERGAFTGAASRKRGLLELAEGGTLLLNEIGELSPALQSKLLSFLDTRKITRIGGEKEVSVDARLLAATNRDLEKEVEAERFRKDLFYRLNVMSITVPPLRERREDIPILVREILSKLCAEMEISEMPGIDDLTMKALQNHVWTGNVRELRNVLERALIVSDGNYLDVASAGAAWPSSYGDSKGPEITISADGRTLRDVTDELVRFMCVEALQRCDGGKRAAARLLGISRDSFYRHLRRLGIFDSAQSEDMEADDAD